MMLKNYNTQSSKQHKGNQGASVPGNDYWLTGAGKVSLGISQALPEPTYVGGWSTGFTANQIARSNRAGQVSALGQMASLVFGGKERRVPSGSGSTPSRVSLFSAVQSQGPTGIDSTYRTKRYLDGSKDIYESDLALTNLNLWVVEARPNQKHAQGHWSKTLGNTPEAGGFVARPKGESHDAQHHPGDYLAEARAKDLHLVNDSLARGVFA